MKVVLFVFQNYFLQHNDYLGFVIFIRLITTKKKKHKTKQNKTKLMNGLSAISNLFI